MSFCEDPVFAGLRDLRAKDGLKALMAKAWEDWCGSAPAEIRVDLGEADYQPFQRGWLRARVVVGSEPDTAVPVDVVLHVLALPELAEDLAETGRQLSVLPCDGPPMFVQDDLNLVGWTLPNGPDLRALGNLLRSDALPRLLEDCHGEKPDPSGFEAPELHRYQPSAAAVVRWRPRDGGPALFAQLSDDDSAMVTYSNTAKVAAAAECGDLDIHGPRPITFHRDLKTLVAVEADGTALRHWTDGGHALAAFRAAGRALAALHRSAVAPSSFWSADQECLELTREADGIGHALPDLTPRLNEVVSELTRRSDLRGPSDSVPIHGAPDGDGILYDGDKVGFAGWDRLALGDPLHDVGRLLAHVAYLAGCGRIAPERGIACVDAIRRGYGEAGGEPLDAEHLAWHVAASLLLIGKRKSLCRLADGWTDHIGFVVGEAERVLSGQSPFLRAAARKAAGVGGRAA